MDSTHGAEGYLHGEVSLLSVYQAHIVDLQADGHQEDRDIAGSVGLRRDREDVTCGMIEQR